MAASSQKIDGLLFSERPLPVTGDAGDAGSGTVDSGTFASGTVPLSFEIEVSPQQTQLGDEVLVSTADDSHVAHGGGSLRREGRDEVAEATAQVGNLDVGAD